MRTTKEKRGEVPLKNCVIYLKETGAGCGITEKRTGRKSSQSRSGQE
jgi:hypothetical protein